MLSINYLLIILPQRHRGFYLSPLIWLPLLAIILAGCAYRGSIDTPPTVKVTWYSYLNGDDIRAACVPGAMDQFRLVYNADYDRQLRSYEVVADGAGGAFLTARAQSGSGLQLQRFSLNDPLALGNWRKSQNRFSPVVFAAFTHALKVSGAFEPAPEGLRLYSDQFYWVASLCREGRFSFNAWLYPSARYDKVTFPGMLFAADKTGVPVAPPEAVGPERRLKGAPRGEKPNSIFQIRVGQNGLQGLAGF